MEHLDTKKQTLSERGKKGAAATNAKKSAQAQTSDGTSTPNKTKQKETQTQFPLRRGTPRSGGGCQTTEVDKTEANWQNENHAEDNSSQSGTQTQFPLRRGTPRSGGGCQTMGVDKARNNWEKLKADALADTNFIYPLISSEKITQQQLEQWLQAFNKILAFRGEAPKSVQDYRMHFLRWFKFRDPQKEDPETFLTPEPKNKAPVVISTQSFLKTPQQIEEEQKQIQEARKRAAK
jgi:hypothetical protein